MSIKPDTNALNKMTTMTEELRYKLQKMIWDKLEKYIFSMKSHPLWLDFLNKNDIEFLPGTDAVHYKHEDFVAVMNPLQYGALKINKETAEKALVLGFFEHE